MIARHFFRERKATTSRFDPRLKNHAIEIPRLKSHNIKFLWNSDAYAPWYKTNLTSRCLAVLICMRKCIFSSTKIFYVFLKIIVDLLHETFDFQNFIMPHLQKEMLTKGKILLSPTLTKINVCEVVPNEQLARIFFIIGLVRNEQK